MNEEELDPGDLPAAGSDATDLAVVVAHLRHRRIDLQGYRAETVLRAIRGRMVGLGVAEAVDYLHFIEAKPTELEALLSRIFVRHTAFFRDAVAWPAFAKQLGALLERAGTGPLRAWCAGCATGEEAYSLALLFTQLLGAEECARRVRVHATDIDESALTTARRAVYQEAALASIPLRLRTEHFRADPHDDAAFVLDPAVRKIVVFGRHDLMMDPPLAGMHIVMCRNTMMYFQPEAQLRLLKRLKFSLVGGGLLVVGATESAATFSPHFAAVDVEHGIYSLRAGERRSYFSREETGRRAQAEPTALLAAALEAMAPATWLFDSELRFAHASRRATLWLGVAERHLGRPHDDIETLSGVAGLGDALERALRARCAVELRAASSSLGGAAPRGYDVALVPLVAANDEAVGVLVRFTPT